MKCPYTSQRLKPNNNKCSASLLTALLPPLHLHLSIHLSLPDACRGEHQSSSQHSLNGLRVLGTVMEGALHGVPSCMIRHT